MRKLVMFNLVTVDGYFAGPNGELDWFVADNDLDRYAAEVTRDFDTALFGRVTYQLFESYWPDALTSSTTSEDDREIARALRDMKKIVFSRTLRKVEWHNSELLSKVTAEAIRERKEQNGRDMVVYGSGTLVQQLTNLGLIDEYRFLVNPVILGEGKLLFAESRKANLEHVETKTFSSGNVLLTYQTKSR